MKGPCPADDGQGRRERGFRPPAAERHGRPHSIDPRASRGNRIRRRWAGAPASVHLVLPIDAVEPGAQDQRAGETGRAAIVNPKTAPAPPDRAAAPFPSPAAGPQEEKGPEGPCGGFLGREKAPSARRKEYQP